MGTPLPTSAAGLLPVREYLLVGLTAAAVTFLLTGLVRVVAIRLGAVANPRARDVHVTPVPRMGGLAMYAGVLAAMLLAHQLPVLRVAYTYSWAPWAVVLAGLLITLVGAIDDRFELDSLTKLAGQVTAAGILVLFGVQWLAFWVPWDGLNGSYGSVLVLGPSQGALLTMLLTVTMVNAMNFVDGLDGLAAGIGFIAAAATCAFSLGLLDQRNGDAHLYPPALISAALAGACLGFLPHNFNPAKIFMGDSGSMLIGLMLAAASTSQAGDLNYSVADPRDLIALLTPLIVVAAVLFVPLLDLVMAIIRRTRKGLSIGSADKMHLHHRFLEIGHSQRRAVLLIYLWAGLLAFGAVALAFAPVEVVVFGVAAGLLLALGVSAVPRLKAARAAARGN
ncbi:glycosyltransferase family 4 protein [Kutzneria kofuensis]|uniref:UDP-GlcNAc:undecaprenyl-phosphate GlcNAc-1-phosphate transferase n=1 Tax=Kutzneria kofuensis TaxID=103725 RepID=A0A7W9NHR9_9PSEU|nr:UDP-GlcNAc:undecaprenyl-phosphate GlcNAc-1-phosphate transferase [Kutzneria kofuensis]